LEKWDVNIITPLRKIARESCSILKDLQNVYNFSPAPLSPGGISCYNLRRILRKAGNGGTPCIMF
jgi:hypothetical protein